MKKFTFLLGSLLVGLSASAQLYVTGGGVTGAPSWDAANPLEVTLADGGYTFKATGEFKISTEKGSWSAFDGAAKCIDGSWNVVAGGSTASANLKAGNQNITAPDMSVNGEEITYKVSADLATINATLPAGTTFPGEGEVTYPDLYLIGPAVGGWNLGDPAYKMTREDNVYTITVDGGLNGEWKINDGTWSFSLGQGEAGQPVVGTEYNLADGNAGNLNTTITEKVSVKVTYSQGGPYTLLLTTDGGGENPPVDPPVNPGDYTGWYFNFGTNSFMDENNEGYYRGVAIPEDGIVEYGEVVLGTDKFQIKVWNGTSDLYYVSSTGTITNATPTVLSEGQGEMTVEGATAGAVYDVKWDMNTYTLTMTKVGGEEPPVTGDFDGWYVNLGWESNPGYWKGAAVPSTGIVEISELKIGADPFKVKIWNGTVDAFYTSEDGEIAKNVPTVLIEGMEDNTMTITGSVENDVYNVKYDCNTNTLTLTFVRNAGGEVEEPKEIYLIGEFNGWDNNSSVKMNRVDNVYTLTVESLEGEWKFNDGSWGWSLGAAEATTVASKQSYELVFDGKNFASEFKSTVLLTITEEDGFYTLSVDPTVSISALDAEEEGTAVYFNLQGQRVDNPANGVYVRVLNGKAEKIIK